MMRFPLTAIHRIWRLLPREARRRLFIRTTSMMVPSRGEPSAHLPVVVAGVLSSATGLGESARMNVDGLRHAGVPFSTIDLSGSLLAPADLPGFDSSGQLSPAGPGTLILHTPGSTLPYALVRCGRKLVQGKRLVGFWHWELAGLPADWRFGCSQLDEIWVPSQFCADAVRKSFAGPIRIIPHPVDVEGVRRKGRSGGHFTALTIFNMASGLERKNPVAAVRAFKKAFGADPTAKLVIKVANPDHYPDGMAKLLAETGGAENIDVLVEVMPRRKVMELIASADAVLSLHRSEGFGMLAAEAMLVGTPVIATDWSATAEFVTADCGMPIPYDLIPANDPQGCTHDPSQKWADADVDAAAAALTRLRVDPDFAQRLTDRARLVAEQRFSVDNYARLIRQALMLEEEEPEDYRRSMPAVASSTRASR
jgi:glycosyltransferase involved in cell wall biosynthesis